MRSKALEKSIIQHLIIEPGLSNSVSQWWVRWIRACVVEQFFIFPNWRWSMDDLIWLRSQRKTKPSSSLLSTGVREIGLRSPSTDLGLDIFGKGRTSADFRALGRGFVPQTNQISENKECIIWDIILRAAKCEVLLKPWHKSGYLKTKMIVRAVSFQNSYKIEKNRFNVE